MVTVWVCLLPVKGISMVLWVWQSLLCFGVIAIVRESRRAASSSPPWRCCWSRVRPAWLLALRATAVVALAGVLLWDLRTYDASIMLYYTEWTLLLEIAYFAMATLFSVYGCLMHPSGNRAAGQPVSGVRLLLPSNSADEPDAGDDAGHGLQRFECFLQIIYQVSAGAVMLTDVVFWCLILPFMSSGHFSLNAVMGCMHSINLAFLLTETALNTLAFPWFRVAYFVLWTCLYVIVQWIAHACGLTWWPYPFLSPAASWAPLWYLALALLHFPCYLVYWLIARAKVHLFLLLSHDERWL